VAGGGVTGGATATRVAPTGSRTAAE